MDEHIESLNLADKKAASNAEAQEQYASAKVCILCDNTYTHTSVNKN